MNSGIAVHNLPVYKTDNINEVNDNFEIISIWCITEFFWNLTQPYVVYSLKPLFNHTLT